MITKHKAVALGVLLIFGVLRQPLERAIASDLQKAHFRDGAMLNLSMREQLGQLGAAAALGGFRSFLATLTELRVQAAWSDTDWDKVESYYNLITLLQPRETVYWDTAGWMLGTNAHSSYVNFSDDLPERERMKLARRSMKRGEKFYQDGLAYNPSDPLLHKSLAQHYVSKEEDFCRAAIHFQKAAESQESGSLEQRHAAFNLAWCPGREREAYEALLEIYHTSTRVPYVRTRLLIELLYLEDILKIPAAQRIPKDPELRLRSLYQIRFQDYVNGQDRSRALTFLLHRLEHLLRIPQEERIPQ